MKRSIWLAAGIAGMFFGNASADVIENSAPQVDTMNEDTPMTESKPTLIMLPELGFSIAIGSSNDIIIFELH
jgi:hypothetical protein